MINVDVNTGSKAIAQRLQKVLSNIIHHNQNGYVKGRTIKMLLLVFKSLNNLSPCYLADRLSYQSHLSSKQLLEQPQSLTKTHEDQTFSMCAPKLWNSLPFDLRKSTSLTGLILRKD